jgi:hypothetical protein
VTLRAALLVIVCMNGCECLRKRQTPVVSAPSLPPEAVAPRVRSAPGSADAPKLALPMREGTSVCDLVTVSEVSSVSGLTVDRGFPSDQPNAATCVYHSSSDPSAPALTIGIAARPELSTVERDFPGGTRLPALAKDTWYVDSADDDASVLYVQDGDTQLTVAIDNRLPEKDRPTIAERIARLALSRR